MPTKLHWTYAECEPEADLQQGDILFADDAFRKIISEVHPHFDQSKYRAFAVASQTCDLVRRKGAPKAPQIAVAAVRALSEVLPKLIDQVAAPVSPGVYRSSQKEQVRGFLKRLFDQNEQALGLFYLHPDEGIALGDPSVVMLRVKIAFRSEHYDVLRRARRGRLSEPFVSKFGWLTGNLYSRVATPDWSDQPGGANMLSELIRETFEGAEGGDGPLWVDDAVIDAALRKHFNFDELTKQTTASDKQRLLLGQADPPMLDRAVDEIERVARAIFSEATDEMHAKLRQRLTNASKLRQYLKK